MEEYTIMLTVSIYKNTHIHNSFLYIGFLISSMICKNNVTVRNIVMKFHYFFTEHFIQMLNLHHSFKRRQKSYLFVKYVIYVKYVSVQVET